MIHLVLILARFADPPIRMQFVYMSAWLLVDITSLIFVMQTCWQKTQSKHLKSPIQQRDRLGRRENN
jgi:hypothetical protein